MEKVWGTREGLCAWCNQQATHAYEGEMTNGEKVNYQVCAPCYDERVDSKCSICESKWSVSFIQSETGFCPNCERAHDIGYAKARAEYGD
jgi:hypothetical protein